MDRGDSRLAVEIGPFRVGIEPAFILAEVGSALQGRVEEALALARASREAGANGVLFQLFPAAELIPPHDARLATFQQIELSMAEWERVLDEARSLGVAVLAAVFDRSSLSLGESHAVAAYKIHSTDMENPELIREVAATGKPLILSTGSRSLSDVEMALEVARNEDNEKVVLLHGVENAPTRIEDSHLRFIATLKRTFGLPMGFIDHVDGRSPMALILPVLAQAFGADLIEKHITLDRQAKGPDFDSALEPGSFCEMVELIRQSEMAFGDE